MKYFNLIFLLTLVFMASTTCDAQEEIVDPVPIEEPPQGPPPGQKER